MSCKSREALEILAVQLASEKITKEQIAELEERLKAFEQAWLKQQKSNRSPSLTLIFMI